MSDKYTTILIGNGLGMSLAPEHFNLKSGLDKGWNILTKPQQKKIKSLIDDSSLDSEEQLQQHYEAIQFCIELIKIEQLTNSKWLRKDARQFPQYFRNYIANVAWHFFEFDYSNISQSILDKYDLFFKRLKDYITYNKPHLITTNYDKILYKKIVNTGVMYNDGGYLIDGFCGNLGFSTTNLVNDKFNRSYYIHLHGSPLFYTDIKTRIIKKNSIREISKENMDHLREHLILCPTKIKTNQISFSYLLRSYWDFFKIALAQSNKIILIGYSGKDDHINNEISATLKDTEIFIVEYNENYEKQNRKIYWAKKLKISKEKIKDKNLILLESILDYEFNH